MKEIALLYLGKKSNHRIDVPVLKEPIVVSPQKTVWVTEEQANWLTKTNPKMFRQVGERMDGYESIEEIPEAPAETKEKPKFVCPKCGKNYTLKPFYDKHIAECTVGDDKNTEDDADSLAGETEPTEEELGG